MRIIPIIIAILFASWTKPYVFGTDYAKHHGAWVKFQKKGITGAGCKIAVLDKGLSTTAVPVEYTYDFVNETTDVSESPGHGTYVTSVIKDEIIGNANGAEVHFLQIYNDAGSIVDSAVLDALQYCIDSAIDVVNMSFDYYTPAFETKIQEVIDSGIVVVAATGNASAESQVLSPAALPGVVAVNSINEDYSIAHMNYLPYNGKGVTVACGGVNQEVVNYLGDIEWSGGTSFSCAFFVGIFACYKQETGEPDNYKLLQHILNKAIKQPNTAAFGYGVVTA